MTDKEGEKEVAQRHDPEERIHVMRLIEYIGPREWVEHTLAASANGVTQWGPDRFTRSTILGPIQDPFSRSFTRPKFAQPEEMFISRESQEAQGTSPQHRSDALLEKTYVIGFPEKVTPNGIDYALLCGPFPDLSLALGVTPDYPNCLIIEISATGAKKILFNWNETGQLWESTDQ